MPPTRISTNLQFLQQHFEQHVNPRGLRSPYFKYTFAVREEDPTQGDARQEYSVGTRSGSSSLYFALALLDVEEARFQRFVAGTARGLVGNLPRYASDLVSVDLELLEDSSLVEETDFEARVARSQREATYASSVSTLEIACDYLEIPLPEDRPDYLGLFQAIHLYDLFDKDFEALLDELSTRLRALPEESRPEASRWMEITARFVWTNPVKVIWRGKERQMEDPVTEVLGAIHQEWFGTDLPGLPPRAAAAVPTQPVLKWSSVLHSVVRVPMSEPATWVRHFQNMGTAAVGLYVKLGGPVAESGLIGLRLLLDGVEHPLMLTQYSGFSTEFQVELEPGSEHVLELVFQARSAGGGFATVEVLACIPMEQSPDGMTAGSPVLKETLQVFVG
ncbi:hypothetical protein LXT21_16515 [Myxococcus sp. K38C18041901]|uniref:hypothetical protein n=1 Tax=Myxococcus guangdongensis TaxID=2906760 RepID=UPI0020A6FEBE|nr:hypothetical protein [Myxococcus guangdongensis]MCP3060384.1 hypothetical protein [Myxococcus guangdongensis]